jgi:hypothetical protein
MTLDLDKSTLTTFGMFRPTQFDNVGCGSSGKEDWFVGPCIKTRDSDALERANYDELLEQIEKATEGEEEETWDTHSFNHWGPGWFEILVVRPYSKAHEIAVESEYALSDYPVIDDERFSRYEEEDKGED